MGRYPFAGNDLSAWSDGGRGRRSRSRKSSELPIGLIVNPGQTCQSLKDLGSCPKPPPGWNFRAVILDQDLVLTPDNGAAKITQDDLGNTYDRVRGAHSYYKP